MSALKEDDTFELLAKWSEPRLTANNFIGLSLDDEYYSLYFLAMNFAHQTFLTAVLSLVALPMESCERPNVAPRARAACKPFILHLFPIDYVTGECPIIEKLLLMVVTKWNFQFGTQNLHGSHNHNPALWNHRKSGKEMMTFSQQNFGGHAMLDIVSKLLYAVLVANPFKT